MPYPMIAGTSRTTQKVKTLTIDTSFRKVLASVKWQPGEIGRVVRYAPTTVLIRSNEGYLTPTIGSAGPSIPTFGQIWPRGNN